MKETPIFEEVFSQMVRLPGIWVKLLIGGLLSFVPIVNLLAFGYLYRVALGLRRSGRVTAPEWRDWQGLFFDGLRFAVVWLAYWLLPLILAGTVAWIFTEISLGALANVFVLTVLLVSNLLFSSALYRFQTRGDFKDLCDVGLIFRMTWLEFPKLIVPSFFILGVLVWLLPLYGLALFAGLFILIVYTGLRFLHIEQKRARSF